MDTPDKKTQPSPSSFLKKFEDSPVFNYISTLSPIKTFSLRHSTESFPLLAFASPQSLETPPTNCPKESNITSVSNVSAASQNNCPQYRSNGIISETSNPIQPADLHVEEEGKFASGGEETVRAIDGSSKLVNDLPISVKYEFTSLERDSGNCGAVKTDSEYNVTGKDVCPAEVMQDVCEEADNSLENEMSMQGVDVEQSGDACEWQKFINEASDILDCHSPTMGTHWKELHDKNVESGTLSFAAEGLQAPNGNIDDSQKIDSPLMPSENHEEAGKHNDTSQAPAMKTLAVFAEEVIHCSRTDADDESSSQQQQTTRRRCLVYEMSGSHYRKILSDPVSGSPVSISAANSNASNEKSLVVNGPGNNKFSSPFPGIGLHLNALAAGGREKNQKIIVKRQNLTCRRQLISSPCTISSIDPPRPNTKVLNPPVIPEVVERGPEDQKDSTQLDKNVCENTAFDEDVVGPQSSPKKKRKKSDNVGAMDSCKRCNCKRSKCLKLYCECFAAGLYCVEPCNCQDCFNKPAHEDTVLETRRQIESRNPLAFAPKVISFAGTPSSAELNKTPASARHKRGCNCKKSGCLKKYCECFQGGVGCSLSCRCEGCQNTFGQKEGYGGLVLEAKILKRNSSEASSHDEVSKAEDQNQAASELSDNAREPVRQPFHFGSIAPQFPLRPCGQSLQSCTKPENDNLNHTMSEETHKTVPDDEALDVFSDDYLLSTTNVKSTSPNSKRISPHHDVETSPGWKSCRKLILRSIPSFPTVNNEKQSMELQGKLQ